MEHQKYVRFEKIDLPNRQWPSRELVISPTWCSVDLRDGNQALETPMSLEQKIDFFKFLINMGFKEIEVGFPAASDTEYTFLRTIIERGLIPHDVTIQVLTQARDHIIEKTFEALLGVRKAVVHLYNSTSTLQRDVVFNKSKEEIIQLAVNGAKHVKELAQKYGREHYIFEYSPESFTGTELPYAAEICNAVIDVWQPDPQHKVIINLPSTVEMAMPNMYADQIEYMCRHINSRENVIISLHAHNDRGTAIAATELGLLAGADRVEGTLFGNGERTGNADILAIALNMYTQGIDTGLDFSNIDAAIELYSRLTQMPVHPRHPYAGELVYTAFSGSHQDAIKKGMARRKEKGGLWQIPYLPIDPMDLGRSYEPIIRINSQSGKGGVSYILEQCYGMQIPRAMQQDFGLIVTKESDTQHKELHSEELYNLFKHTYVNIESPIKLESYSESADQQSSITAVIRINGEVKNISSSGEGGIEAFCQAIIKETGVEFEIKSYSEHSLEYGSKSRAITYISIIDKNEVVCFGAGISSSITKSSLKAVISGVNKLMADSKLV